MEISLSKLKIVSYDSTNEIHRKCKYDFLKDEQFIKFFGQFFVKNSDEYFKNSTELEIKKIYYIVFKEEIIGLIRLFDIRENGMIDLQYAVSPEYRGLGYGNLLLKEVTDYLLKNNKSIRLDINKNNANSIKCALKNSYEQEKVENDTIRYRRH